METACHLTTIILAITAFSTVVDAWGREIYFPRPPHNPISIQWWGPQPENGLILVGEGEDLDLWCRKVLRKFWFKKHIS